MKHSVTQVPSQRILQQALLLPIGSKVLKVQAFSLFEQVQVPVSVPRPIKVFKCSQNAFVLFLFHNLLLTFVDADIHLKLNQPLVISNRT